MAFVILPAMGQGTLIIDQQSTSATGSVGTTNIFQSFTPSLSAINFVQIQAYNPNQEGQELFYVNLLAGSPGGPVIGSTVPISTPVNYVAGALSTLFFSDAITLIPGDTYYIQPEGQANYQPLDFIYGDVPYAGGNMILDGGSFPESMTFSEGIIVPEPPVCALGALGALTALIVRRKRTRKI